MQKFLVQKISNLFKSNKGIPMATNSVQEAIAAALAASSGANASASNAAVRTVQTDSLKATSKSGR